MLVSKLAYKFMFSWFMWDNKEEEVVVVVVEVVVVVWLYCLVGPTT